MSIRITADLDRLPLSVAKARTDAIILWLYKYHGITINDKIVRKSSGKKGCHIILWTDNNIKAEQLLFIRMVLGDDYKRLMLDRARAEPKQYLFKDKTKVTKEDLNL